MDRRYIENEHIVDRYLSGDLTVKEARDFEKYCNDHPDALAAMPIPVRLKARLSRRPAAESESETGVFKTIPSSVTHAAMAAVEDGFDVEDERARSYSGGAGGGVSRFVALILLLSLLAAIGGLVVYGMQVSSLNKQLKSAKSEMRAAQMQAPGSVKPYRVQPVRAKPAQATLNIGWPASPELIDLRLDLSEGKYTQFQITIDKDDGVRVMQIRRIMRDSNKEVRLSLNSSAFGPGDYLLKIDGYTWRGQVEEIGWIRLGLQ